MEFDFNLDPEEEKKKQPEKKQPEKKQPEKKQPEPKQNPEEIKPEEPKPSLSPDPSAFRKRNMKPKKNSKKPKRIKKTDDDSNLGDEKKLVEVVNVEELKEKHGDKVDTTLRVTYIQDPLIFQCEGFLNVIIRESEAINEQQKDLFNKMMSGKERSYYGYQSRNKKYDYRISLLKAKFIHSFLKLNYNDLNIANHIRRDELDSAIEELKELVQLGTELDNIKAEQNSKGNVSYV